MLGYVIIGTHDMKRAMNFWGELLEPMGMKVLMDLERIAYIGYDLEHPMLGICLPYDEKEQHPGNGNMLGFNAGSRENVDKMYERAISLGATDDGPPGPRIPEYNGVVYDDVVFYGAYFKDADGNKAVFYKLG
jgi:hypothetical protein